MTFKANLTRLPTTLTVAVHHWADHALLYMVLTCCIYVWLSFYMYMATSRRRRKTMFDSSWIFFVLYEFMFCVYLCILVSSTMSISDEVGDFRHLLIILSLIQSSIQLHWSSVLTIFVTPYIPMSPSLSFNVPPSYVDQPFFLSLFHPLCLKISW